MDKPDNEVVASVIVTCNRLSMLEKNIDSVLTQTRRPDHIIVVDNNSLDGTKQWLSEKVQSIQGLCLVLLDENLGGAGGFYHGIKKGYELGADWLWTMDDDCVAEPEALENLLLAASSIRQHLHGQIGFLASQVNWIDGNRCHPNIPKVSGPDWWAGCDGVPGCIKLEHASFVSVLINREPIGKVGYPIRQFFIWNDDKEFTRRISFAGFDSYYVPASKVTHHTSSNNVANFTRVEKEDCWKWKYGARNFVAIERFGQYGLPQGILAVGWICRQLLVGRVPFGLALPICLSAMRGLFYDYRRFIEFP